MYLLIFYSGREPIYKLVEKEKDANTLFELLDDKGVDPELIEIDTPNASEWIQQLKDQAKED